MLRLSCCSSSVSSTQPHCGTELVLSLTKNFRAAIQPYPLETLDTKKPEIQELTFFTSTRMCEVDKHTIFNTKKKHFTEKPFSFIKDLKKKGPPYSYPPHSMAI